MKALSKKVNGRQKGSTYERKIAKVLSEWTGEDVHRSPSSGGLRWGSDQRVVGDIVFPVDSKNSFVYELKKREEDHLKNLFLGTGKIKEYWQQVVTDSRRMKEHGMSPCLIFSKNRDKDYVVIPYVRAIFDLLFLESLPVVNLHISYIDKDNNANKFNVMLITLDALTTLNHEEVFNTYRNLDWDSENK